MIKRRYSKVTATAAYRTTIPMTCNALWNHNWGFIDLNILWLCISIVSEGHHITLNAGTTSDHLIQSLQSPFLPGNKVVVQPCWYDPDPKLLPYQLNVPVLVAAIQYISL